MAQVSIQVDKPFYFAGDTVQGHVYLNLFDNINANQIMLKFKGWESVRWIEERVVSEEERQRIQAGMIWHNTYGVRMESSDSSDNEGEQESMKFNYVMVGGQLKQITRLSGGRIISRFSTVIYNFNGQFIPAGQYSFPFTFKTGENYPASFKDKSTDNRRKGRIKYEMQAFVRGFNTRLRIVKCKTEIIMRETVVIKNQKQQMQAHVKSCCCIDQGISKIQCYFEKNAYSPGEDAKVYCILNNKESKSDVTSVTVALINEITYTSTENRRLNFSNTIFQNVFSGLPQGQEGQREQVVKVINTNKKFDQMDIKPTARGLKLQSVYYLKVEAVLAASCTCCSDLPVVKQPILIYPWIPVHQFNPFQNWHPEEMPMLNVKVSMDMPNQGLNNMNNPYQ